MIRIERAISENAERISELARQTFLESHGHSASTEDISNYIKANFSSQTFQQDLSDQKNIYHVLYQDDQLIGYSKIILNYSIDAVEAKNITKLERIYLLQSSHGTGLGKTLFDFNIDLAKQNNQAGMWLFVWVDNKRAIRFYEKVGFEIVGRHDFKISENHYNPNHQLYLTF